jgi:hypothetical protein
VLVVAVVHRRHVAHAPAQRIDIVEEIRLRDPAGLDAACHRCWTGAPPG